MLWDVELKNEPGFVIGVIVTVIYWGKKFNRSELAFVEKVQMIEKENRERERERYRDRDN